jgi:DNA-binding NarL/FixJ family response regulator
MQSEQRDGQGKRVGITGHAPLRSIGTPAATSPSLSPRAAGCADADEAGPAKMEFSEREPIRRGGRPRQHPVAGRTGAAVLRASVVVADANLVLRTAARAVLAASGEFVVYEATNLAELSALVASKRPEVALVDFDLPPAGGLNAVAALSEHCPLRVVIWGFSPKPESLLTLVWAHTYGFLPKTVTPDALVRSLRGVADGEACLSREMTSELIGELHSFARRERSRRLAATLSTREWEVMGLVSGGFTNKQIATALYISEFTVKRHIHNILAKLGTRSRRAAAAAFREAQAAEEVLEALETA